MGILVNELKKIGKFVQIYSKRMHIMDRYKNISKQDIFSLLKENEEDRIYAEKIKEHRETNYNPYPNGWNMHDFYKDFFSDMYIDGWISRYPHGTVVRQAQRSYYYRGESQVFSSSQSSLHRTLKKITDKEEALVKELVSFMKIVDFLDLLLRFNHTQEFLLLSFKCNDKPIGGIDLLYEQLAQHYGLETTWLDITSDLEVALFFACCKFNTISKKWEPLNKNDFNVKYETQYGVIFRRASWYPTNHLSDKFQDINILPVGFQPFMRCHMQNAYVAMMDKSYSLQDDNSFEIFQFRHDEELCNSIFEKMNYGKNIYPHEGLNLMDEEINDIKERSVFNQDTFDYTCEEERFKSYDKDMLKSLLSKYDYKIINACNYFSNKKIREINEVYKDFDIETTYNIRLRTRLTYTSPYDEH
jgi:hypothetical protein